MNIEVGSAVDVQAYDTKENGYRPITLRGKVIAVTESSVLVRIEGRKRLYEVAPKHIKAVEE